MATEYWLKCKVSSGPFPSELVVLSTSSQGAFSLFAPKDVVRVEAIPAAGTEIDGLLKVRLLESQGELRLVGLPVTPLESSRTITVQSSQLQPA